jgi:hypothetical protein
MLSASYKNIPLCLKIGFQSAPHASILPKVNPIMKKIIPTLTDKDFICPSFFDFPFQSLFSLLVPPISTNPNKTKSIPFFQKWGPNLSVAIFHPFGKKPFMLKEGLNLYGIV